MGKTPGQGQELALQTFRLLRPRFHGTDSEVQATLVPSCACPRWKCRQLAGALPTHPCRVGRPHLGEEHLPSGPAVSSPSAILVAACIHLRAHPGFLVQGWLQWLSFLRKRQAKCLGLAQSSAFGEMAHYTPPSTLEQGGDGRRILCNTPQQVFRAKHPPTSHTPTLKRKVLPSTLLREDGMLGWDLWC